LPTYIRDLPIANALVLTGPLAPGMGKYLPAKWT
jgi:hypothetical protein